MKLLWQIREDYCFGTTTAAKNEAEETRRFLNFVDQRMKSTRSTTKSKAPRNATGAPSLPTIKE